MMTRARPLLVMLVAGTLRVLGRSWRVRFEGPDPFASAGGGAVLGATWHRNILIGAVLYRDRGFTVPISRSRDGDWISAVVVQMGWSPPPRGSSSRGGTAALRETIRRVAEGTTVAMLCDGPRGPARRAKLGAVSTAGATGVSVTPIAFCGRPCSRFASWDGTLLPWPFARVVVRYDPPIEVAPETEEGQHERVNHRLEARLNEITDEVDARLGLGRRGE
jgi:lysophospholipid acyltransferase (LPLAT)-like uncharacterized protein